MTTKILVVDDEPSMTRMIQRVLETAGGYDVRQVNDSRSVLTNAHDFQPDLILLDVMMPDIEGHKVADELDTDPQLSVIPYVFLTALVTREDTAANRGTIGGKRFIAKPIKKQEFLDTIEGILED